MVGTLHVMPIDDVLLHEDTDDCPCLPVTEPVPGRDGSIDWMVSHHAWDGRA